MTKIKLAVCILFVSCLDCFPQNAPQIPPGRFQIFSSPHGDKPAIILFDTETGDSWMICSIFEDQLQRPENVPSMKNTWCYMPKDYKNGKEFSERKIQAEFDAALKSVAMDEAKAADVAEAKAKVAAKSNSH